VRTRTLFFLALSIVISGGSIFAQSSGTIAGRILDASDGAPLWGVNVRINGTSIGAATDADGRFKIANVSPGTYKLLITYLGYASIERTVRLDANAMPQIEVRLSETVIAGQEVVVTAQMQGQQAAINQQVSSNSIVNVLSQDRIRELPDQNAAETISRLPGISVQRDGGEASKVVIRGLAPKFNNITINGEKIPSTDVQDRSVDLSSVSSDMLAGIEVYKSPTADKDGDAVGGTVNFAMKKAPDVLVMDAKFQGGNNSLRNQYGDYKGSINVSQRFFENALGVLLTGNIQKADRSSDGQEETYSLSYEPAPGESLPYRIDDMRLVARMETRKRYGASAALDYDFGINSSIFLTGFWSKTDRDETRQRRRFNIQESREEFDFQDHVISTQLFSVGLSGVHAVPLPLVGLVDMTWRMATSQSDQNNPFQLAARFFQMGLPGVIADQGPDRVPASVTTDMSNTWLKEMTYSTERVIDKNNTFQYDLKNSYSMGDALSGYVKLGAKLSLKARERNKLQITSNTAIENDLGPAIYANPSAFYRTFPLTSEITHKVLMSGFMGSDDPSGSFLHGQYSTWPMIGNQAIHDFWDNMRTWVTPRGVALFDNNLSRVEDQLASDASYSTEESIFAGYLMAEVKLGQDIMVLPGIRYERTSNNYHTLFGRTGGTSDDTPSIVAVQDSTGERSYGEWFPMIQTKIDIFSGMSVRASFAKTTSRPNFFDLVPYEMINRSASPRSIQKGNPSLLSTSAVNYDLYVSLFNDYGLFSVGGFYKSLDNISYLRTSYIRGGAYNGFQLTQPVNAADPSTVYGGEIEIQANMTLLPRPFDGMIISGNIAVMKSKTLYPRFQVTNQVIPGPPFFILSIIDTVREAPMPGQADLIGNMTLGYEHSGFSGRISLGFQGKSLAVVGTRAETDGYTDAYYRWDIAVQQKIISGISLFFNANNITAVSDKSSNQRYLTAEQYNGWGVELGMRYRL
jgi:hypothetical protein